VIPLFFKLPSQSFKNSNNAKKPRIWELGGPETELCMPAGATTLREARSSEQYKPNARESGELPRS
jgi:hypothetical protein